MSKFTPSPAEVALVNQIFTQADAQKIGVVTGEAAVKIFSGTKLSPSVLAEIWNLADEDNNGVLTRKGVAVAIRLLGHAQRGERVDESLIQKQGPPPAIEGLNAPVAQPLSQQNTGVRSTKSPPPGMPALTHQDKAKFMKLFVGCGPVNGILSGDKARDVLVKSKLPVDKLSQIWALSDSKNRGGLDATDFIVAMYLIQAAMSGQLQTIPAILPPYVYEQAKPETVASHATGESGSLSPSTFGGFNSRPISTIQPNFTGSSALQPQMTGGPRQNTTGGPPTLPTRTFTTPSTFPFSTPVVAAPKWDVTPEEKANADRIFNSLDSAKRGVLEGDVAVPFLVQSKLSDDILAQVWDLSDINKDGALTKDGFAVALHLIQGKLAGKEIPSVLPPSLIPPSMRSNGVVAPPPPQPTIPEAMRDLMWDDPPASAPSSSSPQQSVPSFAALHPQGTGTLSPQHTAVAVPKPNVFGGSDPFGGSPFGAPSAPNIHRDLLGDDDEPSTSSPPLEDKSAEIGNAQNQLSSTNRSLDAARADRANVERQVAEQASQLSALQTQLSSAKAAYETETRLLSTLRERYAKQSTDINKTREELIRSESDLSALKQEKAELEGSVLRDKEDVRELQRKMTDVGMSVETLKADIEKGKKEAKQQKGLLAIARKQLATREAEKAKVEKELEDTQTEVQSATKEREEVEATLAEEPAPIRQIQANNVPATSSQEVLFAAAQPLPLSPEMTGSPATPATKSTNPFERFAMSASPPPPSQSPFLPFADSSAVPTPTIATQTEEADTTTAANNDDPFGFSEAFDDSLSTAKPPPEQLNSPNPIDVMSPTDTDMFATPLSSARSPAEAAAAHFPPLDAAVSGILSPQLPGHFPSEDQMKSSFASEDPVLNTNLKEIEQEDSDSDTDEDDNEPLTSVQAKLNDKTESEPATNGNAEAGPSTTSAFDDSFGITTLPSNATIRPTTPQRAQQFSSLRTESPSQSLHSNGDMFGSSPFDAPKQEAPPPATTTETPSKNDPFPDASTPADVNAFDEALGKSPSSNGPPSSFTFDSAFDDNFDFAAATAASTSTSDHAGSTTNGSSAFSSTFPPAPSTIAPARTATGDSFDAVFLPSGGPSAPSAGPAVEPTPAPVQAQESRPFSFEDAFAIPQRKPIAEVAPSMSKPSTSNGSLGISAISFDDAFGGVNASEALAFNNTFTQAAPTPATIVPQHFLPPSGPPPPGHAAPSMSPFPTTSAPTSPTRDSVSSHQASGRSSSPLPPRSMSPVPRLSSPKQRPGTANSTNEKEKEKPRHSKLSQIRLPFGRKKKSAGPEMLAPPLPPSILQSSQVVENPTPAAEDDIDAVKQLCQMGFSRGQSIGALEKYGYDVQRALNSLLGEHPYPSLYFG
ncbi:hypothetical protein EUX98_g2432 [Antrodiella citrinella]|uniref:Uncharacterized protein n=1 Tax=Antrodiella citrinella TaxID=2447956 RepID=A0A4S4MZ06_9APHY|nr:hypothetical protein EUX98_g2432 [Antrodiella citrinella]